MKDIGEVLIYIRQEIQDRDKEIERLELSREQMSEYIKELEDAVDKLNEEIHELKMEASKSA